jgi:hypothetical protein
MAGAALVSVLVAIHVLNVDERMRAAARQRTANGGPGSASEPAAAAEPISATEA